MIENGLPEVEPSPLEPSGFYAFTLGFVKLIGRIFLGVSAGGIAGREHVPRTGGFIFASNHASHLDPPLLAIASPRQLTYLAKVELFRNPLFSRFIRSLGAFPVNRGGRDTRAVDTAAAYLRAGHALAMFPEGTRSLDGRLGPIKSGAARLAIKAHVPIVPVHIRGSFEAWPKHGVPRPHRVTIRIGPALPPPGSAPDEGDYRELTSQLNKAMQALAQEH